MSFTMTPMGRAFLENVEGVRLTSYKDSRGIWTIGVGHTGDVRGSAIVPNLIISAAEADGLLAHDLTTAELAVNTAFEERTASLDSQAKIDALISFTFNAGTGNFAKSGVRAAFVAGEDNLVAYALFQFTRAGTDPFELAGRRAREAFIYSRGVYLNNSWKVMT